MNEFFTPFSWGREICISKETEESVKALSAHYEEEGDLYLAEEWRKHARKIAAARAAKELAEADAARFRAVEEREAAEKAAAEKASQA